MSAASGEPPKDSLGLDLDSLKITDDKEATKPAEETSPAPQEQSAAAAKSETTASITEAMEAVPPMTQETHASEETGGPQEQTSDTSDNKKPQSTTLAREKKKPYVNPERVKTGGAQRVCSGPG